MRPSTRASQDLEPIVEDEASDGEEEEEEGVSGTDDDSGPFDSENDDSDPGCDSLILKSSSQCNGLYSTASLQTKFCHAKAVTPSLTNQKRDVPPPCAAACLPLVKNPDEGEESRDDIVQKEGVLSTCQKEELVSMEAVMMKTREDDDEIAVDAVDPE